MRRVVIIAAVTALAAVTASLPTAPAVAAGKAQLSPVPGDAFPYRSFALALPTGRHLARKDVTVRENGRPVSRTSVTPTESAGEEDFGTVLVIDASASMRGKPIRDALRAASAFARERNANQKLAVVTFNRTSTVALPLTSDGGAIADAIAKRPRLANGTHLYDAVAQAIGLLKDGHVRAGSILLLSDGSDTNSGLDQAEVLADARDAGVQVFTIGLRSGAFDAQALARLASGTHADYAAAKRSSDLTPIFAALGTRLANEYLIRYRSLASRGVAVRVEVTVPGLGAPVTSGYVTPPLAAKELTAGAPSGFWGSALSMVLITVLCAVLTGLAVAAVLARRPRVETVSDRLSGFVTPAPEEESSQRTLTSRMLGEADRSLGQATWWLRFKDELEIAGIEIPAIQIVTLTALGTIAALVLLLVVTGNALAAMIAFAIPFGVRAVIIQRLEKQRTLFSEQLADNLQVIASGMRAGHTFAGALSLAVDDSPEPARTELARVVADERLGVPLEDALEVVAHRMRNDDLRQAVLVARLQRETGGNTAEVIDRVADSIRERSELRRIVHTLTAQGRMSRWVVTLLPLVLVLIIAVINPGYLDPLFTTATGQTLLALAVGMVIVGSLVIKRIVDFDV